MRTDNFEPFGVGDTDFMDDDVVILRDEEGRASIVPRSLRNLEPELRQEVRELIEATAEVYEAQAQVARLVSRLRESGVSWSGIGWAVGTTGEAARQRWGSDREDD